MRVGANKRQYSQIRRYVGLGWDQGRIEAKFSCEPGSLGKMVAHIKEKGLGITPRPGTGGIDRDALKKEIRAELIEELRDAGIIPPAPVADSDAPTVEEAVDDDELDDFDFASLQDDTKAAGVNESDPDNIENAV